MLISMEIKREIVEERIVHPLQKHQLPVLAAFGGAVFPAHCIADSDQ